MDRNFILETIAKHGHQLIGVGGEGSSPPFIYTIGLTATHGCELLVVGLPIKYGSIVNDVARALPLPLNEPLTQFANMPLMLRRCNYNHEQLHGEIVCQADHFYGKRVNVVQIVMPDREGRFPEHVEYDHDYMDPRQTLFYTRWC
jgi:Domain of unknown function (DUF4262)